MDLDRLYQLDNADLHATYLASRVHLLDRLLSQQARYQRLVREATRLPVVTEWTDRDGRERTQVISCAFIDGHRALIRSLTHDLLELGDEGLARLRQVQPLPSAAAPPDDNV